MSLERVWKLLQGLRALGPYLLIEILLPGGTLIAFLLWLSQRIRRTGLSGMQWLVSRQMHDQPAIAVKHRQSPVAAPVSS